VRHGATIGDMGGAVLSIATGQESDGGAEGLSFGSGALCAAPQQGSRLAFASSPQCRYNNAKGMGSAEKRLPGLMSFAARSVKRQSLYFTKTIAAKGGLR
jgi:hypothetical protein